jgi:hypothetical protein
MGVIALFWDGVLQWTEAPTPSCDAPFLPHGCWLNAIIRITLRGPK